MSKIRKIALGLVIVVLVIMVGLAIIIPRLADVDRYRAQVAAQIQAQTGKPAEIGHLDLTIFPQVAIRVDDFSLGNPPGFPTGPVCNRSPNLRGGRCLRAAAPAGGDQISGAGRSGHLLLLSDVHGKWNYESPAVTMAAAGRSARR